MNKSELIDAVAAKVSELPKKAVGEVLNAFIATVGEALKKGDDIALIGFGRFRVKERAARTGRNPRTGKEIKIPASKVPAFAAGKALKEIVNAPKAKGKKK
jgi:DNA-binding protein HU-beta